jgi:ribosomal protein S7
MLKLINMIMRHGLKNQALKWTTLSFTHCFHTTLKNLSTLNFFQWRLLFNCLMTTSIQNSNLIKSSFQREVETMMESRHKVNPDGCSYNNLIFLKNLLFDKLSKYSSIFSFYIRRVDKSIRKNSRNKSGKYTVVWKYVPTFKRLFVTLRWFLKDMKFQKSKTLLERFTKLLLEFLLTPRLSFISGLKKFNNRYVFNSYRNSLLKSLKSTG